MITIVIPYVPVSWTSPLRKGRIYYNPKDKEKKSVQRFLKNIYRQSPIDSYVILDMEFYFQCPSSASKKKKQLMLSGKIIPTKKDCTNMQKFYEDCLKKILIDDDRNVANISSKKRYGEEDKIIITIRRYENNS